MADIRINALAGTATSSASDDYLAIDGAANGTRKLSAYSPTFGGNVSVSGAISGNTGSTGLGLSVGNGTNANSYIALRASTDTTLGYAGGSGSASDGVLINTNGKYFSVATGAGAFNAVTPVFTLASTTGNATLAGNLTVSGTGNSTIAGNLGLGVTPVNSSRKILQVYDPAASYIGNMEGAAILTQGTYFNAGSNYYGVTGLAVSQLAVSQGSFLFLQGASGTNGNVVSLSTAMTLNSSGNLLLGTTTDNTLGKLQVAGSVTVSNANAYTSLGPNGTDPGAKMWCYSDGTAYFDAGASTGANPGKMIFRTGSGLTTALTLDSSQNATFAGNVKANGGYFQGPSGANLGIVAASGRSLDLYSDGGILGLTVASGTGNVVIGSGKALKLGNAYTAGAVVSTGYVTIQDSTGTTYKVAVSL